LRSPSETREEKKEIDQKQRSLGNGIYHQRDVYWVQGISTKSICSEDVHDEDTMEKNRRKTNFVKVGKF
jgi:hypothetical protein